MLAFIFRTKRGFWSSSEFPETMDDGKDQKESNHLENEWTDSHSDSESNDSESEDDPTTVSQRTVNMRTVHLSTVNTRTGMTRTVSLRTVSPMTVLLLDPGRPGGLGSPGRAS